ncbi:MAG: outer membrane lipoprotein-sorting protein [Candidatus Theseobacter exili]|nr:outer membrane lipoprotein-sorting protein [Candidatus Theseobacter exili]
MNKTFPLFFTLLIFLLANNCTCAFGNELTADEIIVKANVAAYYSGNDGKADVEMVISDGKGNTRIRKFSILRMNTADQNQKFYVYFHEPADVRKMAYLVWKNINTNDDRWLWLPALNLKKRIAPGDKRTSFVGSDFYYEDVSGRDVNEDDHELIETSDKHYLIQNTPKDPDSVEFSYYNVWIDKNNFLPQKAEYYDKNGKLYRRVKATKIESIDGIPTVIESVASDMNSGSNTKNIFSDIKYNSGFQENIFTERFLRRPPREISK